MNINIFAYGTLMFTEVAGPIAGLFKPSIPAVLPNYARYTINDRDKAKVPALVEEPGSEVIGVVYRNVDDSVLKALDNFEDIARHPQYERRTVKVLVDGGESIDAETYVAGERAKTLLGGPWDPEAFRKTGLKYYCDSVVPRYTSGDRSL